MVVHSSRKYLYFARRVSNSVLRISVSWSHGAHVFWPHSTRSLIMFCSHLQKKWSLKFPSSVPGLWRHIYSTIHENYWSRPSFLYVRMHPWILVPILGLYINSVITTALAWGQCFSPLRGGCFTASPFLLFQIFEWSSSASSEEDNPTPLDLPAVRRPQWSWVFQQEKFNASGWQHSCTCKVSKEWECLEEATSLWEGAERVIRMNLPCPPFAIASSFKMWVKWWWR